MKAAERLLSMLMMEVVKVCNLRTYLGGYDFPMLKMDFKAHSRDLQIIPCRKEKAKKIYLWAQPLLQ